MYFPAITGLMARRLLVNWRVEAALARQVLPTGVKPKVVEGYAVVGLCLVRLERMRPVGMPGWVGLTSENVAARMGVEWERREGKEESVLIFRRDTDSPVNEFMGARIGFGEHCRGRFEVKEGAGRIGIRMRSADGWQALEVEVDEEQEGRGESVLSDVSHAEQFFRGGECGYSPAREAGVWEGLRLRLHRWDLHEVRVLKARSTFIESVFGGAAVLDSAFLMRDIEHTWTKCGRVRFGEVPVSAARALAA